MDTDHISEAQVLKAYQAGWDAYPMTRPHKNPHKEALLVDAWNQGWEDHLKEPTNLSELGF